MSADQDRQWLEAIANGDRGALRSLYDEHYPGLVRFIENRLGDPIEAADVAQDTLLSVWRQASGFEGRSSVKTWMFSIARNKAADRLRRVRPEVQWNEGFDPPDESVDLDRVIDAAGDVRRVRACVGSLGQAQRRVIQLAFYDGFTYGEIAAIENIPEGTIKTRIFHAKRLLMHCLSRIMPRAD